MSEQIEIDMIYVEFSDRRREMSVSVVGCGKDKLIGPVPANGAVSRLALDLQQHLSNRFVSQKEAENYLTFVHLRNMTLRKNAAGVDYPFRITHANPSASVPN